MSEIRAIAVPKAKADLVDFKYKPVELKADQVHVKISHCGVCHSDLHQQHNDWGIAHYPLVPGHEIVGTVTQVGADVKSLKVGDRVGVGPQTGSCMQSSCRECTRHEEQFCPTKIKSYNSLVDGQRTYGGFSEAIRVRAKWAFKIPASLPSNVAAPLLCAGVTTYTPLVHHKVGPSSKVAIVGVGGLGHVAVQFAAKMGAEVTAVSRSADKEAECRRLGATHFLNSRDEKQMQARAGYFDFILSTVSADGVDWTQYLRLLKPDSTLAMVGIPGKVSFAPGVLVTRRLSISGSYLANHQQVQDMLDFSAKHGVQPLIEELPMTPAGANAALGKVHENTARYRMVLVRGQNETWKER